MIEDERIRTDNGAGPAVGWGDFLILIPVLRRFPPLAGWNGFLKINETNINLSFWGIFFEVIAKRKVFFFNFKKYNLFIGSNAVLKLKSLTRVRRETKLDDFSEKLQKIDLIDSCTTVHICRFSKFTIKYHITANGQVQGLSPIGCTANQSQPKGLHLQ